jgi:hypothetical protein
MNVSAPVVILCVASVLLVYALVQAWQTAHRQPPVRKRARATSQSTTPSKQSQPKPWIWSAMKKWDTVRNMMKWKAEMASLDGVIQSIEREALPPPDEKKSVDPESDAAAS